MKNEVKTTWYECPTLRLAGASRLGGIVIIRESPSEVRIEMCQVLGGTHGTEWQKEVTTLTPCEWEQNKSLILKNCVPDPRGETR